MITLANNKSFNNRKMTHGRVNGGASTYLGSQTHERDIQLKKNVEELTRMLAAIDIKIANSAGSGEKIYGVERKQIQSQLDLAVKQLKKNSTKSKFSRIMRQIGKMDFDIRSNY